MPNFIYQDKFGLSRVPDIPVAPTFFECLEGEIYDDRKSNTLIEEYYYPPQIAAAVPPTAGHFDYEINVNKPKKRVQDTIFYPELLTLIPPIPARTGYYTEILDFGTVVNNVILNINWNTSVIVGTVDIQCSISVSSDGSNWSAFTNGVSQFFSVLRFAKVLLTFTASSNKSAIKITNLAGYLNVRYEQDGGTAQANAGD